MLHHYKENLSIYYEKDEEWMIEQIHQISEKLIKQGMDHKNKSDLFTLFESYTNEIDAHILYGKMFPKIIAYISRSQYKILSTSPFQLEKNK